MNENINHVKVDIEHVNENGKNEEMISVSKKTRAKELLQMLDEMNKSFDQLPPHAQFGFVTNCDLNAALLLVAELFRVQQD